jgi:hypothetical protein
MYDDAPKDKKPIILMSDLIGVTPEMKGITSNQITTEEYMRQHSSLGLSKLPIDEQKLTDDMVKRFAKLAEYKIEDYLNFELGIYDVKMLQWGDSIPAGYNPTRWQRFKYKLADYKQRAKDIWTILKGDNIHKNCDYY